MTRDYRSAQIRLGAQAENSPKRRWNNGTSRWEVTVLFDPAGNEIECWPVDAKELLEVGAATFDPPEQQ